MTTTSHFNDTFVVFNSFLFLLNLFSFCFFFFFFFCLFQFPFYNIPYKRFIIMFKQYNKSFKYDMSCFDFRSNFPVSILF